MIAAALIAVGISLAVNSFFLRRVDRRLMEVYMALLDVLGAQVAAVETSAPAVVAKIADLKNQLAAVTAQRDALQAQIDGEAPAAQALADRLATANTTLQQAAA